MSTRTVLLFIAFATLAGCGSQGLPQVIYLARHGQTEWNRTSQFQGDPDLDSVGYINRVSLWHLLKDKPIRTIYTSERQRTQTTAELVARQHKLKIKVRAGLNEADAGILTGICYSQMAPARANTMNRKCEVKAKGSNPKAVLPIIEKAFEEEEKDRLQGRFPLGENYDDMVKRVDPFIDELKAGLRPRQILIVGHGVINRVLLYRLVGWPLKTVAHIRQENDQVYRMKVSPAGKVTSIELYTPGTGWKPCDKAPKPGQKYLSCNPLSKKKRQIYKYEVEVKPAPAPAEAPTPAAAPAPDPAKPEEPKK